MFRKSHPATERPIERIFREVMHRNMTKAERRYFLHKTRKLSPRKECPDAYPRPDSHSDSGKIDRHCHVSRANANHVPARHRLQRRHESKCALFSIRGRE